MTTEHIAQMSRDSLRKLPPVAQCLSEAEMQLASYRTALELAYGPTLRLRTHAVVGIGLTRLVWRCSNDVKPWPRKKGQFEASLHKRKTPLKHSVLKGFCVFATY